MARKVGILTGGGDAPGLNAVIRAFVKYGVGQRGWSVLGIEDSFNGLLETPYRLQHLTPKSCAGLLARGGTVLGTTNQVDPFAFGDPPIDRSSEIADAVRDLGLDGLVVVGGDGTQKMGLRLMVEHGVRVVGVPKTIDNDLSATEYTFGFHSAVAVATEALDRLHTTAESHDRVMLLEVMGRDAGHIALSAGLAGGADCIVIPEIPYRVDAICDKIRKRRSYGRHFNLIVVAEGARPADGDAASSSQPHGRGVLAAGGAGVQLARQLAERLEIESRVTVLGHLQRGGSPVPYDRILATRFGVVAVDLVAEDRWGEIAVLVNGDVVGAPIEDAVNVYRLIDPDGELVRTARAVGIEFGA